MNKTKEIVRPTARRSIIPTEKTFSSRLDRREKRFEQRESTELRHTKGKPATSIENLEMVEKLENLGKAVESLMKDMWNAPSGRISQTNIRSTEIVLQTISIIKNNVIKNGDLTVENRDSLKKECKLLFQIIMSEKYANANIKENVFKAITQLNNTVFKREKENSTLQVER